MGRSLYACKRLRAVRVARGNIKEERATEREDMSSFLLFPFPSSDFSFSPRLQQDRASRHTVTFRICARLVQHLFDSRCYRAPWKTGCGTPISGRRGFSVETSNRRKIPGTGERSVGRGKRIEIERTTYWLTSC